MTFSGRCSGRPWWPLLITYGVLLLMGTAEAQDDDFIVFDSDSGITAGSISPMMYYGVAGAELAEDDDWLHVLPRGHGLPGDRRAQGTDAAGHRGRLPGR